MLAELERVPRMSLATLPTPLQETPRLAAALGVDHLLLKRDDNTGLALGGNKARKLEYSGRSFDPGTPLRLRVIKTS